MSPSNRNNVEAAKKAVRAALILIPLFGLHFLLIPFRPSPQAPGEKAYQVISAGLTSLQGFVVSILFCFANGEVNGTVKGHFARINRQRNEMLALTAATVGNSAAHPRDREVRENIV